MSKMTFDQAQQLAKAYGTGAIPIPSNRRADSPFNKPYESPQEKEKKQVAEQQELVARELF